MMILLVSKILLGYEVVLWSKKIRYKSCQILTSYLTTIVILHSGFFEKHKLGDFLLSKIVEMMMMTLPIKATKPQKKTSFFIRPWNGLKLRPQYS